MHKRSWDTKKSTTYASVLGLVSVLAISACSSGGNGDTPVAPSSAASSASSAPSESVPAGVAKDSVLDLNSTKDMTGVVTTVPINKSPYIDHLPDICQLIPDSVVQQLGATRKKKGFTGTRLVTQGCLVNPPSTSLGDFGINVAIYVNNINELVDKPTTKVYRDNIEVLPSVTGVAFQNADTDLNSGNGYENCRVAWGTFYGSATVNFDISPGYTANVCDRAIAAAKIVAPYMPKSPAQMRPTP